MRIANLTADLKSDKFDGIARKLADYGAKGVVMATHYTGYGEHNGSLEDKVKFYLELGAKHSGGHDVYAVEV